eukprot:NODE_1333_length_624_cov_884.128696_g1049_i0.p1 GENE.NODE_1333_length_624_cov_884.128696_g1049_i0~~NODE_1333_length_624_cov_884.128696_g1049_i0.p1  ORF type:complete len:174 (+),score=28.66 NODE_1333_length_624_cov_884.128696_g1049_i0:33-554(+)
MGDMSDPGRHILAGHPPMRAYMATGNPTARASSPVQRPSSAPAGGRPTYAGLHRTSSPQGQRHPQSGGVRRPSSPVPATQSMVGHMGKRRDSLQLSERDRVVRERPHGGLDYSMGRTVDAMDMLTLEDLDASDRRPAGKKKKITTGAPKRRDGAPAARILQPTTSFLRKTSRV